MGRVKARAALVESLFWMGSKQASSASATTASSAADAVRDPSAASNARQPAPSTCTGTFFPH